MTEDDFIARIRHNSTNVALLERLPRLGLNDCCLTAGCLFQTLWNLSSGRDPSWGVKVYDVFYFDDSDLSWEAEDKVIGRVRGATSDLGVDIEVRNQARVHLWYAERFGGTYPQLSSSRDGIDRYLVACTCVGIDVHSGRLHATYGLDDLVRGHLRMNPCHARPELFRQKALSYQARWPWLKVY